jgi:hypothetical protein
MAAFENLDRRLWVAKGQSGQRLRSFGFDFSNYFGDRPPPSAISVKRPLTIKIGKDRLL